MAVLFIVIPLALLLAGLAVIAFIWMVKDGQLDDLETPGIRLLLDDDGQIDGASSGTTAERSEQDLDEPAEALRG